MTDQLLGLQLVRSDHVRADLHARRHRFTLGVEQHRQAGLLQRLDQTRVELDVNPGGQAAGQHAKLGAPGQVVKPFDEGIEFFRADPGTPFVYLGLFTGGRIDQGQIEAGLLGDADEIGEQAFLAELLQHPVPVAATDQSGRDDRPAEQPEGAGHVDALAAGHGAGFNRTMPVTEPQIGYGDRAVDRRVQGYGDDHRLVLSTL